jgi:polysaccharide export outer membrane protein
MKPTSQTEKTEFKIIMEDISAQKTIYSIAGLLLELVFPATFNIRKMLPSFEPFAVKEAPDQEISCAVKISLGSLPDDKGYGKLLSNVSLVWGENFRFYEQEHEYVTCISISQGASAFKMRSNRDFSTSEIFMEVVEQSTHNVLSWLIMVAYGQACLQHKAILIHAAVVMHRGQGFAFLGKSGTGKSTHARLWMAHIKGSMLLNDDNPAVRLEDDGKIYAYGTPWSGKTPCYKNQKVSLQAFVRLKQAAYNEIKKKTGLESLITVLPSCTAIRWNKQLFSHMSDTLETIIQKVAVAELACLPNREAAELCCSALTDKNLLPEQLAQSKGHEHSKFKTMKKCLLTVFVSTMLLMNSCIVGKKVIYVQDMQADTNYKVMKATSLHIQKNDRLSINISSRTPELAAPFNQGSYNINERGDVTAGAAATAETKGYLVDGDGQIDFPILGSLQVGGKTLEEAKAMIQGRLVNDKLIGDPIVKVELINLKINMLGEVNRVGVLTVPDANITLLQAISQAGGLTVNAAADRITVIREENGQRKMVVNNIQSKEIFNSPTYYLQQNDIVYVALPQHRYWSAGHSIYPT